MPDEEVWLPIPGLAGYQVSSLGRVRGVDRVLSDGRRWRGRIIRQRSKKSGHKQVQLGKGNWRLVHHLVLEAFVGPRPLGQECAHNDGTPDNNRPGNLRWDTSKGNHADKLKHGTLLTGERNPKSKLSAPDVAAIRRLRGDGVPGIEVASRFGVTPANVSAIVTGKTWRAGS